MITVVSGLPRSGTSMMMQMLKAGGMDLLVDEQRTPDHSNPKGYFEFEPVKSLGRDESWVIEAEGKAVKVIAPLLAKLPKEHEYAVIFMNRDLHEILGSQAVMLARLGRSGAGVDGQTLRTVYERQLAASRAYVTEQSNFRMLDIEHRDVLKNPKAVAESVSAFLGIELNIKAASKIVDATLHRQRFE